MLDLFAPSVSGDERLRRAWSRYERHAATPGSTVAIVRLIYESDVRDVLPAIRVPTLVIHRANPVGFAADHGRYLAEHIEGSTYLELPGTDNLIWAGNQEAIVSEIACLRDRRPPDTGAEPGAGHGSVHRHRRLHEARRGAGRCALAGDARRARCT